MPPRSASAWTTTSPSSFSISARRGTSPMPCAASPSAPWCTVSDPHHFPNQHIMDPDTAILEVEEAMTKCVDYLIHEFAGVRTGKASPALIENLDVHVHAYGAVSKLKSLAVINTPEPRMLMVQPFDPSTTRDIEKAIRESKLGLNP